jgi:hypothetical protein
MEINYNAVQNLSRGWQPVPQNTMHFATVLSRHLIRFPVCGIKQIMTGLMETAHLSVNFPNFDKSNDFMDKC